MRCDSVQNQLARDPALAQQPGRLADHLAGCAACRRELAQLNAVVAAVERLPLPEVPVGLRERTLSAVSARSAAPARPRHGWLRRPAWAALAAGVAAMVFIAGRPGRSPLVQVPTEALYSSAYTAGHALVASGGALSDSASLHAMGALAEREGRHP